MNWTKTWYYWNAWWEMKLGGRWQGGHEGFSWKLWGATKGFLAGECFTYHHGTSREQGVDWGQLVAGQVSMLRVEGLERAKEKKVLDQAWGWQVREACWVWWGEWEVWVWDQLLLPTTGERGDTEERIRSEEMSLLVGMGRVRCLGDI